MIQRDGDGAIAIPSMTKSGKRLVNITTILGRHYTILIVFGKGMSFVANSRITLLRDTETKLAIFYCVILQATLPVSSYADITK